MRRCKKRKGFTLIELVIVIAIIAILAAIAIPRYQKSKDQAAKTAHNANVSMLRTAGLVKLNEMDGKGEVISWTKGNKDAEKYVEKWPDLPRFQDDTFGDKKEYVVKINPKEDSVKVEPDEIK